MKNLKKIFDAAQVLAGKDKIISGRTWSKSTYCLHTELRREVFIRTIKVSVAYSLDYFPSQAEWQDTGITTLGYKLLNIKE